MLIFNPRIPYSRSTCLIAVHHVRVQFVQTPFIMVFVCPVSLSVLFILSVLLSLSVLLNSLPVFFNSLPVLSGFVYPVWTPEWEFR